MYQHSRINQRAYAAENTGVYNERSQLYLPYIQQEYRRQQKHSHPVSKQKQRNQKPPECGFRRIKCDLLFGHSLIIGILSRSEALSGRLFFLILRILPIQHT